jgi:2-dehydropantoate 2-reductase
MAAPDPPRNSDGPRATPLSILIVGAGAVGGYYGAILARAGHLVTIVARGDHGRAVAERGLLVEDPGGSFTVELPVLPSAEAARGLGADIVLVAVKASALPEVAAHVGLALAPGGVAIPLLNGLDSEEELARVIGPERVVGGVAQIAARLVAPGVVRADAPGRIVLAPLTPERLPQAERIARAFSDAGLGCEARRDLARVLWAKLLWNAPFNAVCALTRKTAGQVLEVPELERVVREAMQEVVAVARAEGVSLDDRLVAATLDATRTSFRDTLPSMLQDVLAGRTTECRALQGAVVRRGALRGVPTPVHNLLLALVLGLEAGTSPK